MKVWGLLVTTLGAVGAVESGSRWRTDPAIYQAMDPKRDFCVHAFHQSLSSLLLQLVSGGRELELI